MCGGVMPVQKSLYIQGRSHWARRPMTCSPADSLTRPSIVRQIENLNSALLMYDTNS